jgi:hypothetical protein
LLLVVVVDRRRGLDEAVLAELLEYLVVFGGR